MSADPPAKPRVPPPPRPAAGQPASVAIASEQNTMLESELGAASTHERMRRPGDPPSSTPFHEIPPDGDKYLGRTIDGRYVVESVLGIGGMGVVYRCRRKVFDKLAAIKILRSDLAKNPEVMDRFVTEAKAASAIGNAHIVDVFDFGEVPDGSIYFAMEYLEGETLGDLIAAGRVPANRVVFLGRQIAEGLAAAHLARIVHRDLKPDNLFIVSRDGKDFIKILDFGIAKVAGLQSKITRAGAVFGTPHYMSPEQCRGSSVDQRTDIYSLGVILYEMVVGHVPFEAENPLSILSMHMNDPPKRFADFDTPPDVPAGLESVILKCLAKLPEERFESMLEVERALAAIERGEDVEIEVPISVAPPEDAAQLLPEPSFPRPAPAPNLLGSGSGVYPTAGPSSGGPPPVSSSNPHLPLAADRPSFVGDVRASLPGNDVPISARMSRLEAELEAAAREAEVDREWAGAHRRRWPLVAGVVALAAVAGAVVFLVGSLSVPNLQDAIQAGRPLVFGQYFEAGEGAKAEVTKVALIVAPIDAHAWQGAKDLGTMPIEVPVKKGEKVDIEVKRDGYYSRKLSLDGSEPKLTVKLAAITTASKAGHAPVALPVSNAAKASAAPTPVPVKAGE